MAFDSNTTKFVFVFGNSQTVKQFDVVVPKLLFSPTTLLFLSNRAEIYGRT